MKKILIICQAAILSIVAFASFKKNKAPVWYIYYTVAGICKTMDVSSTYGNFTTGGFGSQASIVTASTGGKIKLYGVCAYGTPSKAVHFHP